MNTTISIPDDLFRSADAIAAEMGISTSDLYAAAVAEYVSKHRDEDITARLNEVYREESSKLAADVRRAQGRSVSTDT
ncbi:MAG: hypothetical protein OXG11_01450 [Chloroflexi bacterium]|nr:hypothetical protein [Chloroflexota bacterium]